MICFAFCLPAADWNVTTEFRSGRWRDSTRTFRVPATVFAGGPKPMIATALLAATGSGQAIALDVFGCAVVSRVATAALAHHENRGFAQDHA